MDPHFQFFQMKTIPWMDRGDGSTTVRMYLTTWNCTLKNSYDRKLRGMSILPQLIPCKRN